MTLSIRRAYVLVMVMLAVSAALPSLSLGGTGTAIFRRSSVTTPKYNPWGGSSFGTTDNSASIGSWRIISAAEAPTRSEIIAVGVDDNEVVAGEMWNGSVWTAFSFNDLATVSASFWWGFDVAYEPISGNAMLVWNNGDTGTDGITYREWNGSSWSSADSITTPLSGEPRQIRLASHPFVDEMVLIASNSTSEDYAVVWNGSSWGNAQTLSTPGTGDDRSDIFVAYEQQSGHALVVYGRNAIKPRYRIWNGASWSAEDSIAAPGAVTDDARWTTLGSDPTSDRIALGVTTRSNHTWLSTWDGSAWGSAKLSTSSLPGQTYLNVAVAFESVSGDALAIYGETSNTFRYRTWTSGSGWSNQLDGEDIGGVANSMILAADPGSDDIMAVLQDGGEDINYVRWNGTAWGTPDELETTSGETKNQPFEFLWDVDLVILSVTAGTPTFTFGTHPLNTWMGSQSSIITNSGNRPEDFSAEIAEFTDGADTWTINPTTNGADQIRTQWSTTSASGPWTDISAYDTPFTIATNVAVGDSLTLWLRIQTPTSVGSYLEHSSTLSVSATQN